MPETFNGVLPSKQVPIQNGAISEGVAAGVTLVNTVPSAMAELLRCNGIPKSVRTINLAGEPLKAALVDELYRRTAVNRVVDLYGPTETTTYSTYAVRRPGEPATIGRPIELSLLGHGVATTVRWLPTHLKLVMEAMMASQ